VLLESEPSGATLEIAGRKEGTTPYTAKVDRARLPVPVKVTLEGYEPQDYELTAETGPSRKVTLKKVAVRPTTPRPDNTIKTTR
jgi:serine/threonine-protein kinase